MKETGKKQRLLLHGCCTPCTTHCWRVLSEEYAVTVYYYNPCIHPQEEYERRLDSMRLLSQNWTFDLVTGEYDTEKWFTLVKGLEQEPEGGRRCPVCFRDRLQATAKKARELSCPVFTTTLSISPHKSAQTINKIGREIGEDSGVKFLETDFKKSDGFGESCRLSREEGLYRQNYCGCTFSRRKT